MIGANVGRANAHSPILLNYSATISSSDSEIIGQQFKNSVFNRTSKIVLASKHSRWPVATCVGCCRRSWALFSSPQFHSLLVMPEANLVVIPFLSCLPPPLCFCRLLVSPLGFHPSSCLVGACGRLESNGSQTRQKRAKH